VPLDEGQHVGDRHPTAELLGQRRDASVGDAAGHEPVVPPEVHVAVEGEAVHGHAAADADADGGDLALGAAVVRPEPHAAASRDPRGLDPEVAADSDQRLLDAADVVDDLDVVGQRHDRVADQLARSVEGDLAAAVHVDDRRAAGIRGPLVGRRALAGGEHRRVLEQQDGGRLVASHDPSMHLSLQLPGREVVDGVGAEARDPEVQRHASTVPVDDGRRVRPDRRRLSPWVRAWFSSWRRRWAW
jgi:hypothetical protein